MPPLLIFDTNVLMDVFLRRGGDGAVLLVGLAETQQVELVVPAYVLFEFRGTALRWIRDQQDSAQRVRAVANEWSRSGLLDTAAEDIKAAVTVNEIKLRELAGTVDEMIQRIRAVATVPEHTPELHFLGDLRFLEGRPPDRPADGLKDCRIYETVLSVAKHDFGTARPKYFVTRDADFDSAELVEELAALDFQIAKEPGKLYGQLRRTEKPIETQ